jgi:hypothetical protein
VGSVQNRTLDMYGKKVSIFLNKSTNGVGVIRQEPMGGGDRKYRV